jgi:hypothetical protein
MDLYPTKLVLATAHTVAVAHPYRHPLDPVAASGKGEAQAAPGVIHGRRGNRKNRSLDVDAHARFSRFPRCLICRGSTLALLRYGVNSIYRKKPIVLNEGFIW